MKKIEKIEKVESAINESSISNDDKVLIKCERVNLKYCNLNFISKEKIGPEKLTYSLTARVFGKLLLSELKIQAINFFPENDQFAQVLTFSLVGIFTSDEEASKDKLGNFGKLFTLSILWPFAREFSQDIFQRTGFSWECLPIINAQETTKKMIENGSIEVKYENVFD